MADIVHDSMSVKQLKVRTGYGKGGYLQTSGKVYANSTQTGNVGAGTDTLGTYTLKANSLMAGYGQSVRVICWGKTAANANAKNIVLKFGATVVSQHWGGSPNDKDWILSYTCIQGATGHQTAIGRQFLEGTGETITVQACTEAEGADIIILCTGEGTSNDDIVMHGMLVEFLN